MRNNKRFIHNNGEYTYETLEVVASTMDMSDKNRKRKKA